MNTLYWKCMWTTIRNPGCRIREADIMRCVDGYTAPRINLEDKFSESGIHTEVASRTAAMRKPVPAP